MVRGKKPKVPAAGKSGPIRVEPIAWDSPQGEMARRIRIEVFVKEQRVPPELELDDIDRIAYHVLAYDAARKPMATGRLFEDPARPNRGRIGRMAVEPSARGQGYGNAVLRALMREGLRRGYEKLVLDSQVHAVPFYAKAGFTAFGEEHYDAGIRHRMMEMSAEKARKILDAG
jgi:predicted GNAT family N-acyltransferase